MLADTPRSFVQLLREKPSATREVLAAIFAPVIDRAIAGLQAAGLLREDSALLAAYSLRAVEIHLRFASELPAAEESWELFKARVAIRVVGQLFNAPAADPAASSRQATDDETRDYGTCRFRSWAMPRYEVGGDWHTVSSQANGRTWVLVADVMGKSRPAHILAQGLQWLWEGPGLAQLASDPAIQPGALMDWLDRELEECLPGGVFIAATVGKFEPDGSGHLAFGGGGTILRHDQKTRTVSRHVHHGSLLGLGLPPDREELQLRLEPGDEILLASDGLDDQPTGGVSIPASISAVPADSTLHETVVEAVRRAVGQHGQFDDITLVTVSVPTQGEGEQ
jgi:serine phosphatase RsbU (regulator of sigma subunit)